MTGTLSAPCEHCPERHALCHSTCGKYLAYRAKMDDISKQRMQAQALNEADVAQGRQNPAGCEESRPAGPQKEINMKAKIQLPACYKKEAEAYIAKLEAESIARVHEEVMKERQDIALRSLYLCLLACYQVGLEPSALVEIQNAMSGPVTEKYSSYRIDQLADTWAQVTLQNIGVDVDETGEQL